jgi:hypothetical protein
MYETILGPREHHQVRSADAYRKAHAAAIAKQRRQGARLVVHVDTAPRLARIDFGSWLVDCSCGAGNATDPEWGIALCFGCGAAHTTIVFPDPAIRLNIEAEMLKREGLRNRFWLPGETVEQLRTENAARGVI